jgi:hypothetical protein
MLSGPGPRPAAQEGFRRGERFKRGIADVRGWLVQSVSCHGGLG